MSKGHGNELKEQPKTNTGMTWVRKINAIILVYNP